MSILRNFKWECSRPWWSWWFLVEKVYFSLSNNGKPFSWMDLNQKRARLDNRKPQNLHSQWRGKGECCWYLQANSLFKSPLGTVGCYYSWKNYNHSDEKPPKQQLLPKEQKGCKRKSGGAKYQLLIDNAILRNSKRKKQIWM